ncbi:MAG: hypothetical protein WCO29_24305, partial [Nostocales cyanobacterium ELA583]
FSHCVTSRFALDTYSANPNLGIGMDMAEIVIQTIEGIIAKNDGATLEQINDELIIKGLELGFLDLLKKSIQI